MTQIVDYSTGRPKPADLVADGYVGVMRYLAPLPNKKVILADELTSLHAEGLAVGFVWETVNQRAADSGHDGGVADAKRAIEMLKGLGAPDGTVIYYVLEDPERVPVSRWPDVFGYAQGVKEVGGPYRQGGYGGQALLESAIDQGLIVKAWQVGGWSTGPSALCALLQRSDSAAHPPTDCDVNDVLQDDWGQWSPLGGDDMPSIDDMKDAMREVLNEATAPGQKTGTGTIRATLQTAQQLVNLGNGIAALVVHQNPAGATTLSDEDLTAVANAVNEELSRRNNG